MGTVSGARHDQGARRLQRFVVGINRRPPKLFSTSLLSFQNVHQGPGAGGLPRGYWCCRMRWLFPLLLVCVCVCVPVPTNRQGSRMPWVQLGPVTAWVVGLPRAGWPRVFKVLIALLYSPPQMPACSTEPSGAHLVLACPDLISPISLAPGREGTHISALGESEGWQQHWRSHDVAFPEG